MENYENLLARLSIALRRGERDEVYEALNGFYSWLKAAGYSMAFSIHSSAFPLELKMTQELVVYTGEAEPKRGGFWSKAKAFGRKAINAGRTILGRTAQVLRTALLVCSQAATFLEGLAATLP